MSSLFLPLLVDSFAFRLMYRKSILIHFPVSTAIIVVYLLFNPICTFSGYCVFDFGSRGNLISCPARCPHNLSTWDGMVWYGIICQSVRFTHTYVYSLIVKHTNTLSFHKTTHAYRQAPFTIILVCWHCSYTIAVVVVVCDCRLFVLFETTYWVNPKMSTYP